MIYDPTNWFWSRADGTVYSSAAQADLPADDAGYLAWRDAGGVATQYPCDDSGVESVVELAAVLAMYGLRAYPLTPEETRAAAFGALATRRWQAETAGISIGGIAIPTDRESQALITGAVAGALIDPAQIITWKTAAKDANGVPVSVPLDADTIKAVAMAVRAHVQACFDIESDKGAELGALPDQDAIRAWLDTGLDAGWPDSKQAEEAA